MHLALEVVNFGVLTTTQPFLRTQKKGTKEANRSISYHLSQCERITRTELSITNLSISDRYDIIACKGQSQYPMSDKAKIKMGQQHTRSS